MPKPKTPPGAVDSTAVVDRAPMTAPDLERPSAFMAGIGLEVTLVRPDRVEARIELGAGHHTPWGIVHGGVYAAAAESAASIGASAAVAPRGQIAVGVNNNTDFLRSITSGRVSLEASPVQQGRTQQLWNVVIADEAGRAVARSTVRLQNVEPRR
jgi:1,4-dihydroxy-2-naphthoyl-CoA hydrolase